MDDKDKNLYGGMTGNVAQGGGIRSLDEELPGFKVNDYSGGADAGDDAGLAEGMTGGVVASDEAVGGAAENGPVAHGEGEISVETSTNGKVGGLDETALKTAAGGSGGGSEGISEAEARAMLIEDNARAKEALKKANNRGKKTLVTVIILAVALIAVGVVASVIIGGMNKENGNGGSGSNDKQEGNGGGNSAVVEKPEEPETVELALDDEVVQRVYNNFLVIPVLFDGWWDFYIDEGVKRGEISREYMLRLAGSNLWNSPCVGDYEYGNGGKVENACASGEAVRAKIEEMFGERLELTVDDKLRSFCGGMVYDMTNDEFYQAGIGCGGWSPISMERVLVKAERKGDEIVLYEKVLMFDKMTYYTVGETEVVRQAGEYDLEVAGEKIGEYTVPEDVLNAGGEAYNEWLKDNREKLAREYGSEFKWTFWRNEAGNYVFKGISRVR